MRSYRLSLLAAQVAHSAASIVSRVTIKNFAPETVKWNTNAISLAQHRREIADHQNGVLNPLAFAQQRNHAGSGVIAIYPLKARRIVIHFVQGGLCAIDVVQSRHKVLQAL